MSQVSARLVVSAGGSRPRSASARRRQTRRVDGRLLQKASTGKVVVHGDDLSAHRTGEKAPRGVPLCANVGTVHELER